MKVVAKALIFDIDNNVLILHRGATHPNFPGHLDLPGGEVEDGESIAEAVTREILEETGIRIPVSSVALVHQKDMPGDARHLLFEAHTPEKKPAVTLSWEHAGYEWLTIDEFIARQLPYNVDTYHITALEYLRRKTAAKRSV